MSGPGAGVAGMMSDGSNATLPDARSNIGVYLFDSVHDHNAPTNGTSDAATQINASLTDCQTAGGGRVVLQPRHYVVSSANLTVPAGCSLEFAGSPMMQEHGAAYLAQPAILLADTRTISNSGVVKHIAIFKNGLTVPTGPVDTYNQVNGFSGTAITNASNDTQIEDALIVGFDTCINNTSQQRPYIRHVRFHCKNGIYFDNVHDVGHVLDVHGWAYFPGNTASVNHTQTITGAADNGSGLIRLTVASTASLATGVPVTVRSVGGFAGANGNWTITVVDATHVDLQGSVSAGPTATGTWTNGETFVTVSSLTGLWMGMTVAGVNIAGGTTIRAIDWHKSGIWLSAATTGAGAGTTLTFGSGAYTSGGTLFFDAAYAPLETFISVTNSEENRFVDVFQHGWAVGAYLGVDAIWTKFLGFSCDSFNDPTKICMEWDSNARLNSWIGGEAGGTSIMLVDKASGGVNSIVGVNIREGGNLSLPYIVASLQGTAESQLSNIFSSCSGCGSGTGNIAIYSTAGKKTISGNMPRMDIYPQNRTTSINSMYLVPGTILESSSPFSYRQTGWTPTLLFGGAAAGTYSAQQGYATLAWPYMLLDFRVSISAKSGNTGSATIGNLPARCDNGVIAGSGVASIDFLDSIGLTGAPFVNQNSSAATLNIKQTGATGPSVLDNTNFNNTADVRGSYRCLIMWTQR